MKDIVNLSLQILPRVPDDQLYGVVDQVIALIQASGFPYEVGPMETTVEGPLDEVLELVKEAQVICTEAGASRVLSVIKIDYRPGGVTMHEKIGKYR